MFAGEKWLDSRMTKNKYYKRRQAPSLEINSNMLNQWYTRFIYMWQQAIQYTLDEQKGVKNTYAIVHHVGG